MFFQVGAIDGKNPAPLGMPQKIFDILIMRQNTNQHLGHPKWCRIFFHQVSIVDLDGDDAGDPYLQALSFVALGVPRIPRVCKTSIYLKFRLSGIPHFPLFPRMICVPNCKFLYLYNRSVLKILIKYFLILFYSFIFIYSIYNIYIYVYLYFHLIP